MSFPRFSHEFSMFFIMSFPCGMLFIISFPYCSSWVFCVVHHEFSMLFITSSSCCLIMRFPCCSSVLHVVHHKFSILFITHSPCCSSQDLHFVHHKLSMLFMAGCPCCWRQTFCTSRGRPIQAQERGAEREGAAGSSGARLAPTDHHPRHGPQGHCGRGALLRSLQQEDEDHSRCHESKL